MTKQRREEELAYIISINTPHQLKQVNRERAKQGLRPILTCKDCGYFLSTYHDCPEYDDRDTPTREQSYEHSISMQRHMNAVFVSRGALV